VKAFVSEKQKLVLILDKQTAEKLRDALDLLPMAGVKGNEHAGAVARKLSQLIGLVYKYPGKTMEFP
jgi:hypothetical protein